MRWRPTIGPLRHRYQLKISNRISNPPSGYLRKVYFHVLYYTIHVIVTVVVAVLVLGFTTLLTSQVISVAFCNEREKSDKYCSEALISALGSFPCRKSTTRDPRLYFPSEGSHTHDFYALKKSIDPGRD